MGEGRALFNFFKGNVLVLTITRILGFFSRGAAFPYASLYVLALGGTTESVGVVNSLRPLANLLIIPIAGFLADRRGRVKLIAVATYLSAFTYVFYILANHWLVLAVGSFIGGMIVFHFPAQSALMADSLPTNQRGIGFATYNAVPGAVAVVAPFFAGALIDTLGQVPAMRCLYAVLLVCYAASATIQLKFLQDTLRPPATPVRLSRLRPLLVDAYRSAIAVMKWMPRSLRALTLVLALSFTANAMVGPFWVVQGTQVIGLSASDWGLLILLHSAFRIAVTLPAGVLVDRVGKRTTLIASLAFTLLPVLVFARSTGFMDVLLALVLLAVANAFLVPACASLMTDLIPQPMRGRVMAAMGRGVLMFRPDSGGVGGPSIGYVFAVPVMVGSILGGYIYAVNPMYLWGLVSLFLLASVVVSVVLLREPRTVET